MSASLLDTAWAEDRQPVIRCDNQRARTDIERDGGRAVQVHQTERFPMQQGAASVVGDECRGCQSPKYTGLDVGCRRDDRLVRGCHRNHRAL